MIAPTQAYSTKSGISPETSKLVGKLRDRHILSRMLMKHKEPLKLRNTAKCRSANAAICSAKYFLARTPEQCQCLITITTNQKGARKVSKAISRIIRKHLLPEVFDYVWFLHRTQRGFIHFHIMAAHREPILHPDAPSAADRYSYRRDTESTRKLCPWVRLPSYPLTDAARRLKSILSKATKRVGLGHKVQIEAIDDIDAIVTYAVRYMENVARHKERYAHDVKIRLFGASKGARVVLSSDNVICSGDRLRRFKLAAYCASRGCRSMEAMRAKFGSKWQYDARAELNRIKLPVYLYEEDFVLDWSQECSPEALGVRILDQKYSAPARAFTYTYEEVVQSDIDALHANRKLVLPVHDVTWLHGQWHPAEAP